MSQYISLFNETTGDFSSLSIKGITNTILAADSDSLIIPTTIQDPLLLTSVSPSANLSLRYTSNLKLTSSQLDTIQNITTTSSPEFAALKLTTGASAGKYLQSDASGNTSWQTIPTITPSALTEIDDTNITLTLGGTPNTALLEPVSITAGWTGQLSGSRGGTGVDNSTRTITLSTGSAGRLLSSDASGNAAYSTRTFPINSGSANTVLRSDGTNWVESAGMSVNSAGYITSTGLNIGTSSATVPYITLNGTNGGNLQYSMFLHNNSTTVGTGSVIKVCNSTNITDFTFNGISWTRGSPNGYVQQCAISSFNSNLYIGGTSADLCIGFNDAAPRCGMSCPSNAQIGFASSTTAPTGGLVVAGDTGIGTSSPSLVGGAINLAVKGTVSETIGYISAASYDATTSVALYSGATTSDQPSIIYQKDLRFGTASGVGTSSYLEKMRLTNTGNLGIACTPTQKLEIGGTSSQIYLNSATSNMIQFNINGTAAPTFTTARSAGTKVILYPSFANGTSADHAIGIENNANWYGVPTTSQSHKFYGGTTEWMALNTSGLGIGATPSYRLQVRRDATGALGPTFFLENQGGNVGAACNIDVATYAIAANAPAARIAFTDAGNFSNTINIQSKIPGVISNALTSRVFIDTSGNVCVGNTSASGMFNVGSSNQFAVTSAGVVSSGTWNATAIGATYGGTGQTSYTTGDTLYCSTSNVLSKLAIGTSGQVLSVSGGVPAWVTIPGATSAALTEVDDTNVTLSLSAGASTALLTATSITAGWTGQLSLARGGTNNNLTAALGAIAYSSSTGIAFSAQPSTNNLILLGQNGSNPIWSDTVYPTTSVAGDIIYASATNTFSRLAIGSSTQVLSVSGGVPAWTSISTLGVSSIAGTSNQITASSSTGAVTLALANPLTTPGATTITGALTASSTINQTASITIAGGVGIGNNLTPTWNMGLATDNRCNYLLPVYQYGGSAPTSGIATVDSLHLGMTFLGNGSGNSATITQANTLHVTSPGPNVTNIVVTNRNSLLCDTSSGNAALTVSSAGNIVPGSGALSTSATDGFVYMETCAGKPTGTPTTYTGRAAIVIDTTNNQLCYYNPSTSAWISPGWAIIERTVTSGGAVLVTFSSIPATYNNLKLTIRGSCGNATPIDVTCRFNSDSGANYNLQQLYAANTTVVGSNTNSFTKVYIGVMGTALANTVYYSESTIGDYRHASSDTYHSIMSYFGNSYTSGTNYIGLRHAQWKGTAAINRIDVEIDGGGINFTNGTVVTLYGYM